ncbi:MAG: AAA family ATPase [Clostridiales bacterium]|nr:AAA family ATPase [Clostridiales bacterium]
MLIRRLKVDYFGKFYDKEIELLPGINLLYGENEAGKSTIHTFIRGMLFGIERLRGRGAGSKEDVYTRFLPWDYPGAYGGQMDIFLDNKTYRLQRSFHTNDKSFTIMDLDTGREVKLKEGHISELIPGLSESTFRNTISIEQLRAETDAELARQVANYITNLSIAKTKEVDVEKAVATLTDRRKALESIPYDTKLKNLLQEIEEGEEKERKIDSLTAKLKALEIKEKKLKEERDAFKNSSSNNLIKRQEELMDELPAILERFRTYQGITEQDRQLKNQIEEVENKIISLEHEYKSHRANIKHAQEGGSVNKNLANNENGSYGVNKEVDKGLYNKRKGLLLGLIYIGITVLIAIVGGKVTESLLLGTGLFIFMLIIGGVLLYISDKKKREAVYSMEVEEREKYIKISVSLDNNKELLGQLRDRRAQLEDSLDELHDTIMIYMNNFIYEEELTLEAMDRLKVAISKKKDKIAKDKEELDLQIDYLRRDIDKIRWELSNLEDNEIELIKNRDNYAGIKQKKDENDIEIKAINLALNTIKDLSITIHDGFGRELNQAVSDIISEVTNGRYQDLKVDEKLGIKLEWKDKYIIPDNLSAGTSQQVYLSLRLALADLLLGKDKMPIILDDSFALYDDKRVKAAFLQMADYSQVIIFSCQMREMKILEELGISFNLVKL